MIISFSDKPNKFKVPINQQTLKAAAKAVKELQQKEQKQKKQGA